MERRFKIGSWSKDIAAPSNRVRVYDTHDGNKVVAEFPTREEAVKDAARRELQSRNMLNVGVLQ